MGKVLSFVIAGPAGEKGAPYDSRFKGVALPKIEWFSRLYIIMSVNQIAGLFGRGARGFRHDNRMPRRRAQLRLQSDPAAPVHQPLRASGHVGLMPGLGGNAGMPDVTGTVRQ